MMNFFNRKPKIMDGGPPGRGSFRGRGGPGGPMRGRGGFGDRGRYVTFVTVVMSIILIFI